MACSRVAQRYSDFHLALSLAAQRLMESQMVGSKAERTVDWRASQTQRDSQTDWSKVSWMVGWMAPLILRDSLMVGLKAERRIDWMAQWI